MAPSRSLSFLFVLAACGDADPSMTGTATGAGTTTLATTGSTGDPTTAAPATTDATTGSTGGSSTAADPTTGGDPGPDFIHIHPDDPHRLRWRGQTFFPAGYYPGAALNMTGEDYGGDLYAFHTAVMDALAAGGVNYYRVWANWGNTGDDTAPVEEQWDRHIVHPYLRTGPGEAVDGEPKFDLDQWNPEYFEWIAEAVDLADARGLVVQLILLDCWHAGFGLQYGFGARDYFAAANNVNGVDFADEAAWLDLDGPVFARNRAFVERLVEALGARENLVLETCNEKRAGAHASFDDTRADAWHLAVAEAVRAREDALGLGGHRLVMPVDLPEHRTVAGHHTPDPDNGESIADMRVRLAGEQFAWSTPLISDNDCCPGQPSADEVRVKAWAALSAGAHVDVFNNEMFKAAVLQAPNTLDGIRYVGLVRRFIDELGVDLVGMTPADIVVGGEAWAHGRAGEEYVVVLPQGGAVELAGLPAVTAQWWDPRQGGAQEAGPGPVFTAPGPGDWALHVRVP